MSDNCTYQDTRPRPGRTYQPLKYSLAKRGIEVSPCYIYDCDECLCINQSEGLIYKHSPTTEYQITFNQSRHDKFIQNVNRFKSRINIVRNYIREQKNKASSNTELSERGLCIPSIFHSVYKYIFLAQYIDEKYAEIAFANTKTLDTNLRRELLNNILTSIFTSKSLVNNGYISKSKSFTSDPSKIRLWQGNVVDPESLAGETWNNAKKNLSVDKLQRVRIASIVFQCAESFAFLADMITTFANHVYLGKGRRLYDNGHLDNPVDVFSLPFWEVNGMYQSLRSS